MTEQELFAKYHDLYLEALAARTTIDDRIQRRYELYYGSNKTLSFSDPSKTYSDAKTTPFRKMCFELVEAQVDTSIPMCKVTPRYAEDSYIANSLEEFLTLEADNINSEDINDLAERETRIQGTGVYQVDWDEGLGGKRRHGDLLINFIRLGDFYPQPYIENEDDLEYVFIHVATTVRKVKEQYGKDVQPDNGSKNSINLVVCWYLNDSHEVCKLVWVRDRLEVIYNQGNYFARKRRVCAQCGELWDNTVNKCKLCGNKTTKMVDQDSFNLPDDLYIADDQDPSTPPSIYLAKDTPVKNYIINSLPFVIRRNIAKAGGSLYGISDVDLLEESQDGNNKIIQKMVDNIISGGNIVTLPANCTFENQAGSLKKVRISDQRQKNLVGVYAIQANTQQDDLMQDRLYQIGRQGVGITDAYQGKRDPSAESGKAKEISANQTAGRLESKYVDKTTAYSKLYKKMFEFLLAFSDEKRKVVKPYSGTQVEEASFSKYSFITKDGTEAFLNDDFIFSTSGSYTLSNKKEALWQLTTQTFMAGAFGNPQDPRVILLYWNMMSRYGYPLAIKVLQFLNSNANRLPPEVEQALMANPQLLQEVMSVLQAKKQIADTTAKNEASKAAQIIDPTTQPVLTEGVNNDLTDEEAAKAATKEGKKKA